MITFAAAATEIGWLGRALWWVNQGGIVALLCLALHVLRGWAPAAVRVVCLPELRRHRRWSASVLSVTGIALAAAVVGGLLLLLQPPTRPPGSCWLMVGLTGFLAPARALGEPAPTERPRGLSALLTPPVAEIWSSGLAVAMGVLSLC